MLMWIAGPTLRKAVNAVSRLPLTEIASAPAFQSPSTRIARSESRTTWVTSPPGASSTVMRTPGPVAAANPVPTSSRSIRAASCCCSVVVVDSVARRPVFDVRSRSRRAWSLATVVRRSWIWEIRLARPALVSGALRAVCTAATVTRSPKTAITAAATLRGRPEGGRLRGRARSALLRRATTS